MEKSRGMKRKRIRNIDRKDMVHVESEGMDRLVSGTKVPFLGYEIIDKIIIMTARFELAVILGRENCISLMYNPNEHTQDWACRNGHVDVIKWLHCKEKNTSRFKGKVSDGSVSLTSRKWCWEIPEKWRSFIGEKEMKRDYFTKLILRLSNEDNNYTIYPPPDKRFSFMSFCDPLDVKVVIIGQDPYYNEGQAMGLCFSVPKGVKIPPSLVNIYKELSKDLGDSFEFPYHGDLTSWAKEGVLLLNSSLTVQKGKPNSHQKYGWIEFTDYIIQKLNSDHPGLVFLLWGGFAQKKCAKIDTGKHLVLKAAHPSPLGANKGGWWDRKHFSTANSWLRKKGLGEITWDLN